MKKTVLDLIHEYAVLNKEKTASGGTLPPDREARWAELKGFYDLVMQQDGLAPQPFVRCTSAQIREKIPERDQLRVETNLEIVVTAGGEPHAARVGNLSCGGALLRCGARFPPGADLVLQLANPSRGRETWPTDSVVVWSTQNGSASGLPFRHGVQFSGLSEEERRSLDGFVVDSLENKLLSLRRDALDPEFVHKEQLGV